MFPPKKSSSPAPKKPAPAGGHPNPFAGHGAPPPGPHGLPPMGPPGPPPGGMDPFGGMGGPPPPSPSPLGPPPGMPRPGQGMDGHFAMLNGLGPDVMGGGSPQGPPMGHGGLPVGGSLPQPGDENDPDMGGSHLLQALQSALAGSQGDPYAVPPMGPDTAFQGIGTGDPDMGLNQLVNMLALAQMGVGGAPQGAMAGQSGVDVGPFNSMGLGLGLGG